MDKLSKNKTKPKFILTYFCLGCQKETFLNELENPKCYNCGSSQNLLVASKEPATKEAFNKAIRKINSEIIKLLEQDLKSGIYDFSLKKKKVIDQLEKAKELEDLFKKKKYSSKKIDKNLAWLDKSTEEMELIEI